MEGVVVVRVVVISLVFGMEVEVDSVDTVVLDVVETDVVGDVLVVLLGVVLCGELVRMVFVTVREKRELVW